MFSDTVRIQEGLGVKLSYFIQWMSSFIGSVILGFVIEWRVALAVFLFLPFLAVTAAAGAQVCTCIHFIFASCVPIFADIRITIILWS